MITTAPRRPGTARPCVARGLVRRVRRDDRYI